MPSENLFKAPLGQYLTQLGSNSPTPGGGSASMVIAAEGFALLLMAIRVTLKKKTNGLLMEVEERLEDLMAKAKEAALDDVVVFTSLMAAYKLPKESPEQKQHRAAEIESASLQATQVPIYGATLCLEGLQLAVQAAPLINRNIVSDIKAGALFLEAALKAVLLNVDANLDALIEDDRDHYANQKRELMAEAATLVGDPCLAC